MKKSVVLALVVCSGFFSGTVWAGSVTLPNNFASGTPALAAEVNDNFSAVKVAVDDNHARLTTAEGTIVSHSTAISNNATNISTVATNVATNSTNISNLSTTTSSNTAAIATKQTRVSGSCLSGNSIQVINADGSVVCQADTNSGGTITGVTAGSGLSGGGTTGAVNLSIPTGAITASHLAAGAVGTAAIADGTVASADILNGTIVSADIADGTVASVDILDGTILSADIADNTIASADILDNTVTAADLVSEPGVKYSLYGSETPVLSTCNTTTTLDSVTITVPASGFIYVSTSGNFCTYTAGAYTWLMLDNAPGGAASWDGGNMAYDRDAAARPCAIGQFTPYTFQNVYAVAAGTYTYYLNGCVSPVGNQSYINRYPMVAMYFPTQY